MPSKYKLLWHYVTDKCTQIGLWYVDLETAGYYVGETYDPEEAKVMLAKQIVEVADGTKWFVKDFIPFQYGTLNPTNNFHRSILKTLHEHGIGSLGCGTPPPWGILTPQERKGKERTRGGCSKKLKLGEGVGEPEPYQMPDPAKEPIAALVMRYKVICGFKQDDRDWDARFWGRWTAQAKVILDKVGSYNDAVSFLEFWAKKFNLDRVKWTLRTVADRAVEWKSKEGAKHDAAYRQRIRRADADAPTDRRRGEVGDGAARGKVSDAV